MISNLRIDFSTYSARLGVPFFRSLLENTRKKFAANKTTFMRAHATKLPAGYYKIVETL